MTVEKMLVEYTNVFNDNVEKFVPDSSCEYGRVIEALKYSLLAGGKRLRPALVLEFCKLFGGEYAPAIPAAIAVEMIHTYSLIHDDLPCMDNDEMRRGKPSCHIAYGEDIALLAGDGLQPLAFAALAKLEVEPSKVISAVKVLADCCGVCGMVGGQVIDLESENKKISLDTLVLLQKLKTGKLIEAAVVLGCIIGGATESEIELCKEYALNIGLAFQIRDDILDLIGDADVLGKPIGSDKDNEKNTFLSFMSIDEAENEVKKYTDKAKLALSSFGEKADCLINLADYLAYRNN